MKSLIKTIRNTVPAALLLSCTAGIVHAQQMGQSMASAEKMDKMEMKPMSYMIPQKPEDISPLLNGEKIPMAMLPDASGKMIDLNKTVSQKPTVLIVYRGGWCPYCSKQLSGLQEAAPELEQLGYQLIAVSTDAPAGLSQSASKEKLTYTLLSDADLSLSKQLGIAFKAPKAYWEMLPKTTGGKDSDLLLPVPAVYILDRAGVIRFEYINPDFKQRLNPALLKAAATSIKADL
ncbi:peroxiredoxin-like family protein [uncultured Chitinophaga sp.]|jgi:Peroxiredoxin|uniref:peroxiredoxin-like family protein n=1 Tax=uncultured Chitinophaga sp. TaxID=339340 RepID=UPI0026023B1D|nr:peroxiredoxin-like family protein [uncultured Chitinophaga sp.]